MQCMWHWYLKSRNLLVYSLSAFWTEYVLNTLVIYWSVVHIFFYVFSFDLSCVVDVSVSVVKEEGVWEDLSSPSIQVSIPGPPDPPKLTCKSITDRHIHLEWSEPRLHGDTSVAGYQVRFWRTIFVWDFSRRVMFYSLFVFTMPTYDDPDCLCTCICDNNYHYTCLHDKALQDYNGIQLTKSHFMLWHYSQILKG